MAWSSILKFNQQKHTTCVAWSSILKFDNIQHTVQVKVNLQNGCRLCQWSWHGKLIARPRPLSQSGGAAPIITAGPNQYNQYFNLGTLLHPTV